MVLVHLDTGVDCWCPAQFMPSHVAYTNHICTARLNSGTALKPFMKPQIPAQEELSSQYVDSPNVRKRNIEYLFLAELVLAVMAFIGVTLIENIIMKHKSKKLASDHSHPMEHEYSPDMRVDGGGNSKLFLIIFLVVIAWLWVIGGAFSVWKYYEHSGVDSTVFLCDYDIRQLGNINRHTVQCVFDEGYGSCVLQNIFLCFSVAIIEIAKLAQYGLKIN